MAIQHPSSEPPRDDVHLLSRHVAGPGRRRASTSAADRTRSSPTSTSRPERTGVIFAHGSRFGGHTLFIKERKLYYVYNFLGIKPEQKFVSPELEPGKHTLGMAFVRESAGKYGESIGKAQLYVDDKVVAEGPMKTQAGKFTLSGDGLCIGRDSDDNVSQEYKAPGTFTGGKILGVGVSVGKDQYLDLEQKAAAALVVE